LETVTTETFRSAAISRIRTVSLVRMDMGLR
jgi:hypothetical protein